MTAVTWSSITKGTGVILSNNDLTASHYWSYQSVKTNQSKNSGKWYLELRIDTYFNFTMIGIIDDSLPVLSNTIRTNNKFYGLTRGTSSTLNTYNGATIVNTVNGQLPLNSVIGILLDMDLGKADFYINGVYTASILNIKDNIQDANIVMTTQSSEDAIKPKVTANFGASNFLYTPSNLPSGVKSYDGTQTLSSFNKTLILHNNDYKKWTNGTPPVIGGIATPIMTSNTAPSGIVSASSVYDTYQPYLAFNRDYVSTGWRANGTTNQWISYRFTSGRVIDSYAISTTVVGRTPKDWRLEASDNGSDWITLDTQSSQTGWTTGEAGKRTFIIPSNNVKRYVYYRLFVLTNNGDVSYTDVSELELFEKASPGTNGSFEVVSNTIPTTNVFIEKGMDKLTPLLDRKITTLAPTPMILDSEFTGNGKMFRKKVDLNKYFDIRTITTETRDS